MSFPAQEVYKLRRDQDSGRNPAWMGTTPPRIRSELRRVAFRTGRVSGLGLGGCRGWSGPGSWGPGRDSCVRCSIWPPEGTRGSWLRPGAAPGGSQLEMATQGPLSPTLVLQGSGSEDNTLCSDVVWSLGTWGCPCTLILKCPKGERLEGHGGVGAVLLGICLLF